MSIKTQDEEALLLILRCVDIDNHEYLIFIG